IHVPKRFTVIRPTGTNYKYIISIYNRLFHLESFEVIGVWPASFLENLYIDMIIQRTGECKSVTENLLHRFPILFHPSSVPCHNDFSICCILELYCLIRWSLGKSCLTRQGNPYQKNVDKESGPFHNFRICVWPICCILPDSKIL